jgi:hypothetical protein
MSFYCPKKSMYSCAWCHHHNTVIVSSNEKVTPKYPFDPDFPYDPEDYKLYGKHKKDEMYHYPHCKIPDPFHPKRNPLNLIIKCLDCERYSNVRFLRCKSCMNSVMKIIKIGPYIHPEDIFEPVMNDNFVCDGCKYTPPHVHCDHHWVKHSGEIFSECTAANLVCTKCGCKKTRLSNEDRDPFGRDDYDFYK